MKKLLFAASLFFSLGAFAQVTTILPGAAAPDFNLKNIDNKMVSFANYPDAKGYIVIFTCNQCPYAKGYEARIKELDKKYTPLGYPVIAINPNDPGASPADSYEKMQEKAKANGFTYPYLFDDGQVATAAYGAKNTPHIFLVNRTDKGNVIVYTGAIDNDPEGSNDSKVKYLEDAIAAIGENKTPPNTVTKAIGCGVKWKK